MIEASWKLVFMLIGLVVFCGSSSKAAAADYWLELGRERRVQGTVSFQVTVPKLQVEQWFVFAAAAPQLPGQLRATTELFPPGQLVEELSPLKRPILFTQLQPTTDEFKTTLPIEVRYDVTLRSRTLRQGRPPLLALKAEDSLSAQDRELALAAVGDLDYQAEKVQQWIQENQLNRTAGESDLALARRVFQTIARRFHYDYQFEMDRSAEGVCQAGKSDCGGLSAVFVAVMRSAEIPARTRYGRWAKSAKQEKLQGVPYYQWHVKAEFWVEGIGWVPVDPALAVTSDRSPQRLAFFGHDGGDFITFHLDPNFTLDTIRFGHKQVLSLQRPVFWVTGQGSTDPIEIQEDWKVHDLPTD